MTIQELVAWQAQRICELEQMIAPERKLALNERVHLQGQFYARFDGQHVLLETFVGRDYVLRLRIPPELMSNLLWFNRRVVDAFAEAYSIKLEEIK